LEMLMTPPAAFATALEAIVAADDEQDDRYLGVGPCDFKIGSG